jgi:voltage-gated sodium channel
MPQDSRDHPDFIWAAANPPSLRERLRALIETPRFERLIIGAIVLNAITLGLETSSGVMAKHGGLLHRIDEALLAIFTIELAMRLYVYRSDFWRDPWSIFDFTIVAITLLPATGNLSILRSLRILRALRLITAIPSIRRVVGSLLAAIPSMGSIIVLLLIINYVYSVMATKLFAADDPENFGTLGASFFTFFQIMTLEGWAEIVRKLMEKHPWAWAFFLPYIILATFMVLNLFIGIVVDAMQNQQAEAQEQTQNKVLAGEERILAELAELRTELRRLTPPQSGSSPRG